MESQEETVSPSCDLVPEDTRVTSTTLFLAEAITKICPGLRRGNINPTFQWGNSQPICQHFKESMWVVIYTSWFRHLRKNQSATQCLCHVNEYMNRS